MKRFVQMTAATGLALSLAFGNVAIAQQDQHTQANGPQHQMAPRKIASGIIASVLANALAQ
jgi:hypothetical protein